MGLSINLFSIYNGSFWILNYLFHIIVSTKSDSQQYHFMFNIFRYYFYV